MTPGILPIRFLLSFLLLLVSTASFAQLKWQNVDSLYQPLPPSVHVYFTDDRVDTSNFRAFYLIADLKDKNLGFTTDTTSKRRFTPKQFYEKNKQPLVVVNCTFFEFVHHSNLNLVIKKGKILAHNTTTVPLRGKDTLRYAHAFNSAIGITKKRKADVAWTFTDSSKRNSYALQSPQQAIIDSNVSFDLDDALSQTSLVGHDGATSSLKKWKVHTAVGGGPVLVQNSTIQITNNEERKFYGKAINDKHPRTAMGYTSDNKLIILVVEGRNPNAGGATLTQEAQILKDLGCVEALNLDGGGSSCLLINGKETIKPSDKGEQRAVPAVFIITTGGSKK
jgi:hypothetical protein